MRAWLWLLVCLGAGLPPSSASAQKSVGWLPRAHAAALQRFLARHPGLEFLPESECDPDLIKDACKQFGPGFTPYYRRGDFNRDGRQDFAMILAESPPVTLGSGPPQFRMTVVVFNGQKRGGYRPAFVDTSQAPLTCFLALTREKKPRLYFAIYETDAGFIMTPAGRGYIIEHWKD